MEEKKVYKIGLMPLLLLVLDIILIIVVIIMGIVIKNKNEKLKKVLANNSNVNSESIVNNENNVQSENTIANTTTKVTNTITDTNIIANKKEEEEGVSSKVQYAEKIVENKSYIYDAQYNPIGVKANNYSTNDGTNYFISDIVVPYVNMNSDDAKQINSEIEELYNKYVEEFKVCSQNQNSYIKVNYETYITSNVHSILITVQRGKEDSESKEYISYNFDNISGEKLDYNQVCYVAGITDAATSVKSAIDVLDDFSSYYLQVDRYNNQEKVDERNAQIENNKQQIFTSYQQDLLKNNLVYFLDNNLKLNITLNVVLPDGENYIKIVTI